jgi:hypothetical protein
MRMPGRNDLKDGFTMNNKYKKHSKGSHIIVGLMIKTKTENANSEAADLFPSRISFKITSENIITGRSGLGYC